MNMCECPSGQRRRTGSARRPAPQLGCSARRLPYRHRGASRACEESRLGVARAAASRRGYAPGPDRRGTVTARARGAGAGTAHIYRRVHFTGQLVETENLHQFFDVSVLCSRSEGFPNAVIEALAAGCPVVATPVGGVPEVIIERQTGLLVPVDQPDALAASVQELRRDAGLRERLCEAGPAACVAGTTRQSSSRSWRRCIRVSRAWTASRAWHSREHP